MPTIPVPTEQSVFSRGALPYQDINASPADFGALQGRAMSGLGQTLNQASEQTQQTALVKQQFVNEGLSTQALNQFQSRVDDLMNGNPQKGITGYRTLEGADAINQGQNYQQQVQQAFNEARDSLNPAAQRAFDMMGHWALRSAMSRMGSHYAQQQVSYNYRQARSAVLLNQQIGVDDADDPDTWASALAATQAASLRSSQIMGLDGDAAEAQRQSDLSSMFVQRTEQLATRNPIEAADFYHKNINAVLPAQRFRLESMLKTTTDAQYSRTDGLAAFHAAIGQTVNNSPLPSNEGADFVKPYTEQQINDLAAKVKASSPYDPIIDKVAQQYGINPLELKMRLTAESGLNPNAVSPQGAVGIAQIMPATAKKLGIDPKDPEQAIQGAARLMVQAGGTIGGNMSAVDRDYYGGSTTAQGKNTDQYVDNMRALRQKLFGPQAAAPMTAAELEGREADVLQQAKAFAERRRPGDAVYQDQVVAEAQKNWARDVQSLRNQEYANTQSVLGAVVQGGFQSPSEMPPQLLQTYSQLTPQNMESVQAQFVRNQRAAGGEFTPSDPSLVNSLQSRIFLPQGDPNKITDPSQIMPYISHGLNYTDSQRLIKTMQQYNSPADNLLLKKENAVAQTARRMLLSNQSASAHPELAEEAAYRFSSDLQARVAQYKKEGKDPMSLFMPSSPDYVLAPARVAAYMPTPNEQAAHAAGPAASYPIAVNSKTGERLMLKDGSWQPLQ